MSRHIGVLAAMMLGLCATEPAAAQLRRPTLTDYDILLAWDTRGVDVHAGVMTVHNDRGYAIEIDRLQVRTASIHIIPCEAPPGPPGPRPNGGFGRRPGPPGAGARPGQTRRARLERPLTDGAPHLLERLRLPHLALCDAHYLIARAGGAAVAPEDQQSVQLRGRYRRSDQDPWTAFTIDSGDSHGILVDLRDAASGKGLDLQAGEPVVVTRRLAGLFDGVDFATVGERQIARQMLWQLVSSLTIAGHGQGL